MGTLCSGECRCMSGLVSGGGADPHLLAVMGEVASICGSSLLGACMISQGAGAVARMGAVEDMVEQPVVITTLECMVRGARLMRGRRRAVTGPTRVIEPRWTSL